MTETSPAPIGAVVVAVVLLLFAGSPGRANADALVLNRFTSSQPNPRLEEVLFLAAGVELTRAGLSSARSGDAADYLLVADYSATDGSVLIHYSLHRMGPPDRILAAESVELPIDNDFDIAVARAVAELLRAANIEPEPSPNARIVGLLPEAPVASQQTAAPSSAAPSAAAPAAAAPATPALTVPPGTPGSPTSPGASSNAALLPAGAAAARRGSIAIPLRFDSSLSGAGMVFFGDVTQFFHYGAGGVLTADVTLPLKGWSIAFGTKVSTIRVFDDTGVSGGPLYLSTAGANLEAGFGAKQGFRTAVDLAGGAALVTIAGTKVMTMTVPFGELGARASIALGRILSLGAQLSFQMIFVPDVLVMGAVPALSVRLEP